MKRDLAGVGKRFVAGVLVAVAIVGVSTFTIHAPAQRSTVRSLNSIQTDKATLFYAQTGPQPGDANWFVEQVAVTGENKDATENLKLIAAAL
jgi:hypothetical protein